MSKQEAAKSETKTTGPKSSSAGGSKKNKGGGKRLRPGELDDLVLIYLRRHKAEGPHTATVIAKAIKRSSGALANCLERQAKAKKLRRASGRPRRYEIAEPKAK